MAAVWIVDDAGRDVIVPARSAQAANVVSVRQRAVERLAHLEAEAQRYRDFLEMHDAFAAQVAATEPHDGPVCVSCQKPRSQGSASMCRPCWLEKAKARWAVAS